MQLELHPSMGMDGSRSNAVVFCAAPSGWHSIGIDAGSDAAFALEGSDLQAGHTVYLHVETFSHGGTRLPFGPAQHSFVYVKAAQDGPIRECKPVAAFNGGGNGQLRVWRLLSQGDDYYFTFFRRGETVIEIYLRAHDIDDMKPYIASLQDAARSVQVVEGRQTRHSGAGDSQIKKEQL